MVVYFALGFRIPCFSSMAVPLLALVAGTTAGVIAVGLAASHEIYVCRVTDVGPHPRTENQEVATGILKLGWGEVLPDEREPKMRRLLQLCARKSHQPHVPHGDASLSHLNKFGQLARSKELELAPPGKLRPAHTRGWGAQRRLCIVD